MGPRMGRPDLGMETCELLKYSINILDTTGNPFGLHYSVGDKLLE